MRLANGERNGVKIIRLKRKLGTRALPTAELELKGMRAWLIGEEGEGIKQIATVLNITRVHNAVSAISFMRRGLAIAKVCLSPPPESLNMITYTQGNRHSQKSV